MGICKFERSGLKTQLLSFISGREVAKILKIPEDETSNTKWRF